LNIGRNCLLGLRKKIAKFLMRTFTCRSTFLYGGNTYILMWLTLNDTIFIQILPDGQYL
jgi:hypothetical protein